MDKPATVTVWTADGTTEFEDIVSARTVYGEVNTVYLTRVTGETVVAEAVGAGIKAFTIEDDE